jgi:DNA-binding NarL/FixJ family response regulator
MEVAPMPIKILIADDHDIIRAGLRSILDADPDYLVVAEACTGLEALDLARQHQPSLIIMDVSMPDMDGIEATKAILREFPDTKVLALSMHENRDCLVRMLRSGASGFLLKIGAAKEILSAIHSVLAGRTYLSPSMIDGVVKDLITGVDPASRKQAVPSISPRQQEVLKHIVSGKSVKEIAFQLGLSAKTVEKHRAQLMEKLGAKSIAELTMMAIRMGLADPWQ